MSEYGLQVGTADVRSAGPITFGPAGLLFLAAMFLAVSAGALVVAYFTEKTFGIAAAAASSFLVEAAMVCCTTIALARAKRAAHS